MASGARTGKPARAGCDQPPHHLDWARRELLLQDRRSVLQAVGALGRYSAQHWISDIDIPTSVLVHRRDQLVPPPRQVELACAIQGAVTRVVDGDHFSVVREPRPFVRALVAAIDDVARAGASTSGLRRAS
jgi:surfactin synthase thioesterase subunit